MSFINGSNKTLNCAFSMAYTYKQAESEVLAALAAQALLRSRMAVFMVYVVMVFCNLSICYLLGYL